MIPDIAMEADFTNIEKSLDGLLRVFDNHSAMMNLILEEVQELMEERFASFDKYYSLYSKDRKKRYAKEYMKTVGVKTGNLLTAFQGGSGNISQVGDYSTVKGALAIWGIDKKSVPSAPWFDGWLKKHANTSLVELSASDVATLIKICATNLFMRIDGVW